MAEQSREPEILKSIIDDTEYNKTPQSRNEEILLSILNDTEYTKTPQSREEELLLELKGKIGHGITVEPLSVTENGTYTAPTGKAYSPVEVTITPPQLVKRVTGNPVEFIDGADAPLVKCTTAIQGNQDLHGYDKPWVGGANVNKMPPGEAKITSSYGVTITSDGNGIYTFVGTCTEDFEVTFDCDEFTILSADNLAFYLFNTQFSANTIFVFYNGSTVVDTWSLTPINRVSTYTGMKGSLCNKYGIKLKRDVTYNLTIKPMLAVGTSYTEWTPYSNICPITAYTEGEIEERGKNIWDEDYTGISATITYKQLKVGNGSFTLSTDNPETINLVDNLFFMAGYVTSGATSTNDGVYLNHPRTVTAVDGYVTVAFRVYAGTTSPADSHTQLEKGTTPTDYEPCTSTTHTATFSQAIYQGNADFVGGSAECEKPLFTNDGTGWNVASNGAFYLDGQITGAVIGSFGSDANIICNLYPSGYVGGSTDIGILNPKTLCIQDINGYMRLIVYDNTFSRETLLDSLMAFTNFLAQTNIQIVYELATPTTETITPTNLPIKSLFGYNHIESSTGDMVIDYITDQYQNFVDTVNRAVPNTRKSGTSAMDVFLSLEQYKE